MRRLGRQEVFIKNVSVEPKSVVVRAQFTGSATRLARKQARRDGDVLLVRLWGSEFFGSPHVDVTLKTSGEPVRAVALVTDWNGPRELIWEDQPQD